MAACAGTAMAAASSGSLDSSFGRGGRVFASFSRFDTASGVAVQRGGGVLVSGRVGGRISIVRFDRRGRLTAAFGSGGLVREPVGADPEEKGKAPAAMWVREWAFESSGPFEPSCGVGLSRIPGSSFGWFDLGGMGCDRFR